MKSPHHYSDSNRRVCWWGPTDIVSRQSSHSKHNTFSTLHNCSLATYLAIYPTIHSLHVLLWSIYICDQCLTYLCSIFAISQFLISKHFWPWPHALIPVVHATMSVGLDRSLRATRSHRTTWDTRETRRNEKKRKETRRNEKKRRTKEMQKESFNSFNALNSFNSFN